jgi:transcriptional regulator with XRE-family HTH domain
MAENIRKLLRVLMDHFDCNQAELAGRLGHGITQPQISRWLKGSMPEIPSYDRIVELAHEAGLLGDVRSEDVSAALPVARSKMVKLKGYVGAGSHAHFYAVADEDYEEVAAPMGANEKTIAVEIRGKSLGPLLSNWLVFYDDVRSPVTSDLVGQLCVVGLSDGRVLVKEIQRNGRGGYKLLSNTSELPIDNVDIEWAAKVTEMRPR